MKRRDGSKERRRSGRIAGEGSRKGKDVNRIVYCRDEDTVIL